jgi:5-methylcytosine-specific restriction protein B
MDDKKLRGIVTYELIPLIKEYWFDDPEIIKIWSERLREAIK